MISAINSDLQHWYFPSAIVLFCVWLVLLEMVFPGSFCYERDAISQGGIWRLVTGHFTHIGPVHLALNLLGLLFIWLLTGHGLSTI